MRLLHNIGKKLNENYNTPAEIKASKDVLTFDGVYRNVWENREILLGRNVKIFVTGAFVGKDNSFDIGMPLERFCDWNEIMDLVMQGAKLGWHSWTHRDLTKLNDAELLREVTPPFLMETFAYPYGKFDERVIKAVQRAGYKRAYTAGPYGDDSDFQRKRTYL